MYIATTVGQENDLLLNKNTETKDENIWIQVKKNLNMIFIDWESS